MFILLGGWFPPLLEGWTKNKKLVNEYNRESNFKQKKEYTIFYKNWYFPSYNDLKKKSTCSMLKSQCSNCFYIEKKNYHKAYSSRLICQLPPPYVVRVLKIIFFFSYSNLFILQFSDILGEKNFFSLFLKKKYKIL